MPNACAATDCLLSEDLARPKGSAESSIVATLTVGREARVLCRLHLVVSVCIVIQPASHVASFVRFCAAGARTALFRGLRDSTMQESAHGSGDVDKATKIGGGEPRLDRRSRQSCR